MRAREHGDDVGVDHGRIVGGNDDVVPDPNRKAQRQLRCPNDLAVVPGATHLFEEPGALEEVARLAINPAPEC